MKLWVRVVRGLTLAGVVLGGVIVGSVNVSVAATTGRTPTAGTAIVVEGNRRVEADTIRSYFRLGPGERLDAVKIDEGLKALYATGLFQDVRINQAGGRLVVSVIENPVINRIAFEGNRRIKDEQLNQEIQSKARGTFSRPLVQSDVQRIVDLYRRAGRYDVRVDPKIIERPNNRIDLVFEITEGSKTGVKTIEFVGNRAYSAWRLKDAIKTSQSNLLSFLKNSDLYDPDRIEADRELLRRFYVKNGYADVRIVAAVAEFDPSRRGFAVTFTIDEGERYVFGTVDVQSNVRDVDANALRSKLRATPGSVYNAEAVEKTVEEITIEVAKRGYPFAQVRPRGDRNFETRQINVVFVLDEGARAYVERINIRGNTRTRDYVIRREFDIGEGDAYNRVLIDRAERRLKNLNYFKTVKITSEPGSAPDRVIVNVDVEEQSTGEFSIAGGYSTADGFIAEVSVGERNLLGRGQAARVAVTYGQRSQGFELSFVEPYFLDYRLGFGIEVFGKINNPSSYYVYETKTLGGGFRFGIPLREDLALNLRYSVYRQEINLDARLRNCNNVNPDFINSWPTPAVFATGAFAAAYAAAGSPSQSDCYMDGEAGAAIKQAVAAGPTFVSLVGYGFTYNTLDNNKNPTKGVLVDIKQDFAGVGGDVQFIRTTGDARYYYEVMSDLVAALRLQGGHITSWGNKQLRILDHFGMGPNLVRGFAPAGLGPRDITPGTTMDSLGGSMYWGASVELQAPIFGVPKDFGMRLAVFADAGSLWGYKGPTTFAATGETITPADSNTIRSSVGAGLIWDSPFGPIRIDYAIPLTKDPNDKTQAFRFSGGTRF